MQDSPVADAATPSHRRRVPALVAAMAALGVAVAAVSTVGAVVQGAPTWGLMGRYLAAPGLRPGIDVPSPRQWPMRPLGAPAPAPYGTGGHAFLTAEAGGTPVTFDPCRPVPYVVQPVGAPSDGAELLGWAFAELSRATGLRFTDEGTTTERATGERAPFQPARYGDRWAPVLVDWSGVAGSGPVDPAGGDVLGRAGPLSFGTDRPGSQRLVSGVVALHGPALQRLLDTGRTEWVRAVLLHELGHLVGLGHVEDPYQVMYGVNAAPVSSYRAGDLRGLERLGTGRCHPDY